MDNSQLLTLTGFSLFFGFLFGFNLGSRYEIQVKVVYHERPQDFLLEEDLSTGDKLKIL